MTKIVVALDDVTLQVRQGELFGLLGPNGAGKTTLIKILTTLLAPTSGSAFVAGHDVARSPDLVRPRINMVSGGESSGYGLLTVRENLWMFSQFYGLSWRDADRRIRELLDVVKMTDRIHTKSSELSTGLRQKMNIVRAFLTDPDVVFLDEPTLGLDVGASRDVRTFVRRWIQEDPSRTVVLTTHYMTEADELCDRVAIINAGRVLACDAPSVLKRRLQQAPIYHLEIAAPVKDPQISSVPGVEQFARHDMGDRLMYDLTVASPGVITGVIAELERAGAALLNLTKREPTLEDVFVDLVGRSMTEVEQSGDPTSR